MRRSILPAMPRMKILSNSGGRYLRRSRASGRSADQPPGPAYRRVSLATEAPVPRLEYLERQQRDGACPSARRLRDDAGREDCRHGANLPELLLPGQPDGRTAGEDPPGRALGRWQLHGAHARVPGQRESELKKRDSRGERGAGWRGVHSGHSRAARGTAGVAPDYRDRILLEPSRHGAAAGRRDRSEVRQRRRPSVHRAHHGHRSERPLPHRKRAVLCGASGRPRGGVHRSREDAGPGGCPRQRASRGPPKQAGRARRGA